MVRLSYWNSNGYSVPTTTTKIEFNSMAELAKYCVLMGNIIDNYEILPIAIDDEKKQSFEVNSAFIQEHYIDSVLESIELDYAESFER